MADATTDVDAYQRNLLAAMAQGGQRAAEAFTKAHSAANAAKQSALDAELATSQRYANGDQAFADQLYGELAGIIGKGTDARIGQLGSQSAFSEWNAGEMRGANERYFAAMKGTIPGFEAELLASLGDGGGGGGGGGRGGSDDDWMDMLRDTFGTTNKSLVDAGFHSLASGDPMGDTSIPEVYRARDIARMYGLPEFSMDYYLPESDYVKASRQYVTDALSRGVPQRRVANELRRSAQSQPGNQSTPRRYFTQQYRQAASQVGIPKRKKKKGKK